SRDTRRWIIPKGWPMKSKRRVRLRTFVDAHAENPRGLECHDAPRRDRGGDSGLWITSRTFILRAHMEGAKGSELEVLSRNDHVDDFRQNRVHDVRRFCARKADTPKHGVGEIGARHAARIPAGRIYVGDCIRSSIERWSLFGR